MTYTEALKAIASHSGYAQLAQLCAEDNPDHRKRDKYRGLVIRLATPGAFPPPLEQVKNAAMAAGRVVAAAATGQPVMAAPEVRRKDSRSAQHAPNSSMGFVVFAGAISRRRFPPQPSVARLGNGKLLPIPRSPSNDSQFFQVPTPVMATYHA